MAYVYQPYPKMLHRPDGSYKVVQNEAEKDAALADGWNLKPGPVHEPEPEPPEIEPEPQEEEPEPEKRKRGRPRKTTSTAALKQSQRGVILKG
jgi:hypothetical protein